MKISLLFLFFLIATKLCAHQIQGQEFVTVHLMCEYSLSPLGIDSESPSISWNIHTKKRNRKQGSYQILVSSDSSPLIKDTGDIRDSKKVISSENINISYREGNKNITAQKHIKNYKQLQNETIVNVGSGDYTLTVALN